MYEISILHDQVTAFLHGQSKMFISPQKGIQRTNRLRLGNSEALCKVIASLNDVTESKNIKNHASGDDICNGTQIAQGAWHDFILQFAI